MVIKLVLKNSLQLSLIFRLCITSLAFDPPANLVCIFLKYIITVMYTLSLGALIKLSSRPLSR